MNLRCLYCQTPFTLSRTEMLTALVTITEKNMNHYDAHCPRCRRANSISRQRMELFFPNWQEAAKHMPAPTTGSTSLKTQPLLKGVRKTALKTSTSKKSAATSAKPSASKRKRATKPASAKKSVPLKPSPKTPPKGVKSPTKKGKK